MLFMCATKFDLEQQQLALINEFLPDDEKELINAEKSILLLDDDDTISDIEEDRVELSPTGVHQGTHGLSERARGKRRMSVVSDMDDEVEKTISSHDEASLPLPDTQVRMSRRSRKRARRDDDQFVTY
jgi:hypothetical protein